MKSYKITIMTYDGRVFKSRRLWTAAEAEEIQENHANPSQYPMTYFQMARHRYYKITIESQNISSVLVKERLF